MSIYIHQFVHTRPLFYLLFVEGTNKLLSKGPMLNSRTFSSSVGHPNADLTDARGHFVDHLDGGDVFERSNKRVAVCPSQSNAGSHTMFNYQPMPHAFPPPTSAGATQTSISPHVVKIHTNPEPRTTALNPEEQKRMLARKALSRLELKRNREKQRRSDVNTQFADLTTLLKKVEAEDVHSDENRKTFTAELNTSNGMSRVELIDKTMSILNRIHSESLKRKRTIDKLNEELKLTKRRAEEATSEFFYRFISC